MILDEQEIRAHKAGIEATTRPAIPPKRPPLVKQRWGVKEFNSDTRKEQGVDITQAIKANRQSGERVFNSPAPQSDDDSLYKSQDYHTQGEEQMINVQRANVAAPNSVPRGIQFLSPKHVTSPDGFKATISKVTTDKPDNFGNPYVVYFSAGAGERFMKGFKGTSENLISLVDMLGTDEKKWLGAEIIINKKADEDGERLVFLPVDGGKKAKR